MPVQCPNFAPKTPLNWWIDPVRWRSTWIRVRMWQTHFWVVVHVAQRQIYQVQRFKLRHMAVKITQLAVCFFNILLLLEFLLYDLLCGFLWPCLVASNSTMRRSESRNSLLATQVNSSSISLAAMGTGRALASRQQAFLDQQTGSLFVCLSSIKSLALFVFACFVFHFQGVTCFSQASFSRSQFSHSHFPKIKYWLT